MLPWQLHPLRYFPLLSLAPFKSPQSLSVNFWIKVPYSSLHRLSFIFSSQAYLPVSSYSPDSLFVLIFSLNCRTTLTVSSPRLSSWKIQSTPPSVGFTWLSETEQGASSYLGSPSAKTKAELHSTCREQNNKTNWEHQLE